MTTEMQRHAVAFSPSVSTEEENVTDPNQWTDSITIEEAATAWGIAPSTLRAYVANGQAPPYLPGYDENKKRRISRQAFESWVRPGRGGRFKQGPKAPQPQPETE